MNQKQRDALAKKKKKAPAKKKAASKKKAPAKKSTPPPSDELAVGEIVSKKDVRFKSRESGSKYDAVIEKAKKLKKGQVLMVTPAADEDIVLQRNRLGAVMRRKVTPVISGTIRLRVTEDDKIAIVCD